MSTFFPVECASCHRANDPWRRFCGGCGSGLPGGCITCGAVNRIDERFCGGCGGPLRAVARAGKKLPPAPPKPSKPAGPGTIPIDVRDVLPQD